MLMDGEKLARKRISGIEISPDSKLAWVKCREMPSVYLRAVKSTFPALQLEEFEQVEDLPSLIRQLNEDASIKGIMLDEPSEISQDVIDMIDPGKDVDCITSLSTGKLVYGLPEIRSCTASACMALLEDYEVEIEGKHAVVVGRSKAVGLALSILLQKANATVTLCHSKTRDLAMFTSSADILCVAIGKPQLITRDMVKPGAVVIDVGINQTPRGIVGDVDTHEVMKSASLVTPVPKGVGPVTLSFLYTNFSKLSR